MTIKLIIFMLAGSGLGYLYHKKIGCASGACPITANPYASALYGAFLGLLIGQLL